MSRQESAIVTDGDSAQALLRVLMVGEVYGKAGRKAVATLLPQLRRQWQLDLVIANGESAAGGFGLTSSTAEELLRNEVDVITSGNRVFDQREMVDWLKNNHQVPVLRPLNYPPGTPGRASLIVETVKGPVEVLNLNGRIYFNEMDSPFRVVDNWLKTRTSSVPLLVDFHAEATSEKVVLGWYLDGRVSAVLGSHTRTPTDDARLLKHGTAHITDVGMVGPYNSVAGLEVEAALKPFTSHVFVRPKQGRRMDGPLVFNSVLVEIEPENAKAVAISRLDLILEDESM
jgi:metallophosphoesterase (TIGR00282 family)